MKLFNLLLAAMFLLFAFVQINDPDPVMWILIYGVMAVACIFAAFGRYYPAITSALAIIFLAYSFFYISGVGQWINSEDKSMLFDDIAKMQYPYIEESREFRGLFICIAVLVMHLLTWRTRRSRAVS